MFLLDPNHGRRRRAYLRDRATHAGRVIVRSAGKTARDLRNRAVGVASKSRVRIRRSPVSDAVLVERVRSAMGRVVSHPHPIRVTAADGQITLSGPVLTSEEAMLLSTVSRVPGVKGVENHLERHEEPGHVSALQGEPNRPVRSRMGQANWPPTQRFLVGAAGGALAIYGVARRGAAGTALGLTGLGLLTRAATNLQIDRLTGLGAGFRAVDLHKTIHIAAPIEEVFAFCVTYENWPKFMAHVREIRSDGGTQSHWVVDGPAGMPVSWDAMITEFVPNELLAWKSVEGSMIEQAGIMRFEPNPDGTTRLDLRLSYNPPAGAVGHAFATLTGANPERQMDEDFARLKSLIEEGRTSAAEKGEFARDQLAA
jgi:uncharacterized membrane protein